MEDHARPWLNLVGTKVPRQTDDLSFGKTAGEREIADPRMRGQGTPTLVPTKITKVEQPRSRRRGLERRYGLEPDDYEWLDRMGRGRCWICEQPESVPGRSLAIDHDHRTGAIRGLLCTRCNQVLGRMKDDAELLRKAAAYLDNSRADFSDGCDQCLDDGTHDWIAAPVGIVETDEAGTRFAYEHHCGRRWTCWHATVGVPTSWRLG